MPLWVWAAIGIGLVNLLLFWLLWFPPQARGIKRVLWLEYAAPSLWKGLDVMRRPITVIEGHWLPKLWGTGGVSLWKSTIALRWYGSGILVNGQPSPVAPAELVAHEIMHCEQKRLEGGLHYLVGSVWDTVTIRSKKQRPREAAAYAAERAIVEGTYGPFTVSGLEQYPPLGRSTQPGTGD